MRVLSATNTDLTKAIAAGQFRQDLYYRLNVVQLHLPELKQRPDDILPLARFFLTAGKTLTAAAEHALLQYQWPGNVRELQNICQRAELLSRGELIDSNDLGLPQLDAAPKRLLDDIDRTTIELALAAHSGVIARAAKQLGISRQALYRRMEFYGIATP